MLTVQDDWIQYEAVPVRRTAVRGGTACAQRIPVVRASPPPRRPSPARPPAPTRPLPTRSAPGEPRLRLTRRGRVVLVVLPGLLALSGALVVLSSAGPAQSASAAPVAPVAGQASAVPQRADAAAPGLPGSGAVVAQPAGR